LSGLEHFSEIKLKWLLGRSRNAQFEGLGLRAMKESIDPPGATFDAIRVLAKAGWIGSAGGPSFRDAPCGPLPSG
jgi:hypothetical protein